MSICLARPISVKLVSPLLWTFAACVMDFCRLCYGLLSPVLWTFVACVMDFWIMVMVFNTIFNNISIISWWSVLLMEETGVLGENHRPVASHWQDVSHNVVSSTPRLSVGLLEFKVVQNICANLLNLFLHSVEFVQGEKWKLSVYVFGFFYELTLHEK